MNKLQFVLALLMVLIVSGVVYSHMEHTETAVNVTGLQGGDQCKWTSQYIGMNQTNWTCVKYS
ncbi:hypothetical protein HZC07_06150 [Candidatus Micrarchaeota archaeon]|nr:hypothetical protein [Candidatus Micrarchaeota archaeon]